MLISFSRKPNALPHVRHFHLILVVVNVIRCVFTEAKHSITNPLNGQHIRLIANVLILENEVNINNVSGALEGMKGVSYHMMDYLTHRFNFTYSIIQGIQTTSVQSKGQGDRGLIDWVIDGTAELMVGPIIMNHARFGLADLTLPWYQSYGYLLIPKPQPQANLTSVMKPFQWPVWVALLVSIAAVVVSMYFVSHFRWSIVSSFTHRTFSRRHKIIFKKSCNTSTTMSYLYAIGVLLSQGGPCSSRKLAVRVLAAAWCLAAAVLVNSYSSVLITYILAPNNPPLITSAYDLAQKDDVYLIVDKGRGIDILITTSTEKTGVLKELRQRVNSYPHSRCAPRSQCIAMVKSGKRITYGSSQEYLMSAMKEDFQTSGGKCLLEIVSEGYMSTILGWVLQKRSRYTDIINKGILEMHRNGIIQLHWTLDPRRAIPPQCKSAKAKGNKKKKNTADQARQLSLKDLTGAFIILLIGWGISVIVFLGERLAHRPSNKGKFLN
ncbi:hypothetical protein GHT06_021460 [Daphnia sinensis]|uniref:Ionotropic glutamate receptor C-terminal domain-containing protein n=1 Tax=Daphnia sinensis TaxID=1820382 RepID=A0AAD5KJ43_9CRUS|nr:hypothetical protein GHT06_021460 [Daphnia sinensis]